MSKCTMTVPIVNPMQGINSFVLGKDANSDTSLW